MANQISFKFLQRKDVGGNGRVQPIYLHIRVNGVLIREHTGVSVVAKDWHPAKQIILNQTGEIDLNVILLKKKNQVNGAIYEALLSDKVYSKKDFSDALNFKGSREDFIAFVENQKNELKGVMAKGTIGQYVKLIARLKEFKPEIPFLTIDAELLYSWNKFLHHKDYEVNTIASYHKNFKKFIRLGIKLGKRIKNPYQHFKIRQIRSNRTYLSAKELKVLWKNYNDRGFDLTRHRILRWFLFMCFTGVRVNELLSLKKENIINNKFIDFRPDKTRKSKMFHKIKLSQQAKILINESESRGVKLFNCIAEQKINEGLKLISTLSGIDKPLTNHSGRHTFAVVYLQAGGKLQKLQALLGHKKIETTMVYVHLIEGEKDKGMKKMEKLLS